MGLFSRTSQPNDTSELLDNDALPSSADLTEDYFEPEPLVPQAKATPRRNLSYGIEDAISLMRKLPADNMEVVVSVVKQTLESTNINVDDIIADANDKEDRLLKKNTQLEKEIKDLQQQIADRNKQIASLLEDHKETVSVRERLQLANEIDARSRPKAVKRPAAPTATTTVPTTDPEAASQSDSPQTH